MKESWEIKQTLNFNYTKSSLVAFVPIVLCVCVDYGVKRIEKIDVGKNVGYCFFDIVVQQKSWDVPGEKGIQKLAFTWDVPREKGIQELAFTCEDFIGRFSNLKLRLTIGIFSCTTLVGTSFIVVCFFIVGKGDRTAPFCRQQSQTALKTTIDHKKLVYVASFDLRRRHLQSLEFICKGII